MKKQEKTKRAYGLTLQAYILSYEKRSIERTSRQYTQLKRMRKLNSIYFVSRKHSNKDKQRKRKQDPVHNNTPGGSRTIYF